jgi:hypothetical protein
MTVNSTNYKFNTPQSGTEEDTWGDKLNENWDKMDSLLYGASFTDGESNVVEQIQPDLVEGSWAIAGTAVTSTATELNLLDGVTATTSEINILAGLTTTQAELHILDGDTSTTPTTVAGADGVVMNDDGTMKQVPMTNVSNFVRNDISTLDLDSLDVDDIRLDGSTITTTTNGTNLTIEPYGSGDILLKTDLVQIQFDDQGTGASPPVPVLQFYNISNSPGSGDSAGGAYFYGKDSNNVKRAYASIDGLVDVATAGSHDGKLIFSVAKDGDSADETDPKLTINSTTVKVEENFVIGTSTSVDSIKDEDDMSSDSATALATQQSIKAYVDNEVSGVSSFPAVVHIPKYYETDTNGPDYKSDTASGSNTALSITGTVPAGATHAVLSGNFVHVSNGGTNEIKVSLDDGTTYTSSLSDFATNNVQYHRQLFFALSDAGVSAGDAYDLIIHWDNSGGSANSGNYAAIYDGLLTWVVT